MSTHVYCDESTHLPNDGFDAMILGALWCPSEARHFLNEAIRTIKKHYFNVNSTEVKWTKISHTNVEMYLELVELFFSQEALCFRAVIASGKAQLDHTQFEQTHDDWYYKMYYQLLRPLLENGRLLRIFLDIKDTRSEAKVRHLGAVLRNKAHDWDSKIVQSLQSVRSHEVELLQIADILIGAINYTERNLASSGAKIEVRNLVQRLSGLTLTSPTAQGRPKIDIFRWSPQPMES